MRLTHIGSGLSAVSRDSLTARGPTVLIELDGWRLLTDPTFDPPGRAYRFGWGTGSTKLAGPSIAASELGRIDAVLLTHEHHEDNLDPAGRALLPSAGVVVTTAVGRAHARRDCPRPAGVGVDDALRGRAPGSRRHRDAVPPRPAAQSPAGR